METAPVGEGVGGPCQARHGPGPEPTPLGPSLTCHPHHPPGAPDPPAGHKPLSWVLAGAPGRPGQIFLVEGTGSVPGEGAWGGAWGHQRQPDGV